MLGLRTPILGACILPVLGLGAPILGPPVPPMRLSRCCPSPGPCPAVGCRGASLGCSGGGPGAGPGAAGGESPLSAVREEGGWEGRLF